MSASATSSGDQKNVSTSMNTSVNEQSRSQYSAATTAVSSSLKSFVLSDEVTKAEVTWCLQIVMNHIPFRTAAACVATFPQMFGDSEIAKKLQLQRTKIAYSIIFGIAPYFKNMLTSALNKSQNIIISFDESLNSVCQRAQMDIHVRFWDPEKMQVSTRYYDSVFLERTHAIDLFEVIKMSIGAENMKKVLQISMDGPNVNHKVFKEFDTELKDTCDGLGLLDIGSCGLHVVNGAFKSGVLKTEWMVVKFLKAIHTLFKDSPARRALYTLYSGSCVFPKKFCTVRWLENSSVAERALEILPNIKVYVSESVKSNTAPTSQSFSIVTECIKDKMLGPKIAFFGATVAEFEPFLREFQSNMPLAPFLYKEFQELQNALTRRVVTTDAIKAADSVSRVNIHEKKNLTTAKNFTLDFSSKAALRKVEDASPLEILQLKKDMQICIMKIIEKLKERSPLNYKLTRGIACLDPSVATNQHLVSDRVTACLEILVEKNRISGIKADRIKQEFIDLCKQPHVKAACKSFNRGEHHLDKFWMEQTDSSTKSYSNFREFVVLVCLLSHGNAAAERGFSVNNECLIENQHEHSLVAQRHVYDAVLNIGGINCVNIDRSLLHYMRNAHSRYKEFLVKQREEAASKREEELQNKRKLSTIQELEAKKAKLYADAAKEAAEIENSIAQLKYS